MSHSAHIAVPMLVLIPLAFAVAAFLCERAARHFAIAAVITTSPAVLIVLSGVVGRGRIAHEVGGWGAPLGINLAADGLSALLLLATLVVVATVTVYGCGFFERAMGRHLPGAIAEPPYFWSLWLLLWTGLNALFLSGDIFNLYVTLELVGFAAVALVALGADREALEASMRYLLVSLAGSLFFLLGVALLYGTHSTVDLSLLAERLTSDFPSTTALALMTAGLLMKGALVPLHFWLPAAHASAPAPVSAALSALVVKGPFYILVRLWLDTYAAVESPAAYLLGALGVAAILWGSVQALLQTRLKLLIAYSTVAQLGYLFLAFPLAGNEGGTRAVWTGASLILLAHACAKAALFLVAGNIKRALGHDRLADLGAAARISPVSFFAIGLAGLSIVGLPPSGGFAGKWLLLTAALEQGHWWVAAATVAGSLLAAAYILRCVRGAFSAGQPAPAGAGVPRSMEFSAFALALIAAVMGLGAWVPVNRLLGDPTTAVVAVAAGVLP